MGPEILGAIVAQRGAEINWSFVFAGVRGLKIAPPELFQAGL